MPKVKMSFKEDWLLRKDGNGHIIREWCEATNSKYLVHCKFCNRNIKCDNHGFSQLLEHAEKCFHIDNCSDVMKGTQLTLEKSAPDTINVSSQSQSSQGQHIICWSNRDNTTRAEVLWAMKVVSSNYSFNSSQNTKELFANMFPDSTIAQNFSVSPSKLSYLISDAIGPYFHEVLLYDVKKSGGPFTLVYDELSNKQIKKQLDIKICYWSNEKEVRVHHLNTYLMGHATAADIAENIMKSIDENNLLLKDLLMLGSDGPNINKSVSRIITEAKKALQLPGLQDIGTCSLHTVHNAFGKGIEEFGQEAVDLIIDLHNYLKLSPVRMEDIKSVQNELSMPELKFLKHVECRWLTLSAAIQRVLDQWPVLTKYFAEQGSRNASQTSENARFRRIWRCIKEIPCKIQVQLHFMLIVSKVLQPYLLLFQREEPLIHVMYDEMLTLTSTLLCRLMKTDAIRGKTFHALQSISLPNAELEMSDDDLEIGNDAHFMLKKLTPGNQKTLIHGMCKFYHKVADHLLKKLPANSTVIKESRCLKAEHRCKMWTINSIKSLAHAIHLVPPIHSEVVCDEWKILQCKNINDEWHIVIDEEGTVKSRRIDHYWKQIFNLKNVFGQEKFPELARLVKAILTLSHGNADPERGFSQSAKFLTDSRVPLSQACITAMQSIKDGLKQYNSLCHQVPITKELLQKARLAHQSYITRLAEEKRINEELQKKKVEEKERCKKEKQRARAEQAKKYKNTVAREKDLAVQETEAKKDMETYTTMINEANERIKKGLKDKDLGSVKVRQTMLEAAYKRMGDASNALENVQKKQKDIEQSKRTMLDYFCKQPAAKSAKKS